jgi:carbohydrate-selective porin OprB
MSDEAFAASALFGAQKLVRRAEDDLERLLVTLYGRDGWSSFDTEPKDRSLEIYGVIPSPANVQALFAAGFSIVREHDHDRKSFLRCACKGRVR